MTSSKQIVQLIYNFRIFRLFVVLNLGLGGSLQTFNTFTNTDEYLLDEVC